MHMILTETKSGPIELVKIGQGMFLQFNCNCEDALPYCQAMCCRMRMSYNVLLTEEEAQRLNGVETVNEGKILPVNRETWDCFYLSKESKCQVYDQRPENCRNWHCSPKGNLNDASISRREHGWILVPSTTR